MNHNEYDALDQALADLYDEAPSFRFEKSWREAVKREEQLQMKNRKQNRWMKTILPIAAALVLVLGAGWAGTLDAQLSETQPLGTREARSSKSAAYGDTTYEAASGGAIMANYSADAMADEAASTSSASGTYGSSAEPAIADERKLIRTVDLSLRTDHFDQDVAAIQQLLTQHGGYIESLYEQGEADGRYGRSASLTMRVPSENLDAFLTGVEGYGRITSRSETVQDMTEQYTDNQMRIETLRTKMERLTTLLAQAENVSDILEIESEIADTQYELDRYESRQLSIDRKVDMSYVYINVQETIVQDAADDEELTLGQRLSAALKASIQGLGRFGRNLLVFLVMALPVIVPVAVIVLIVWLIKRKKSKAQPSQEPDATEWPEDDEESGNE